MKDVLKVCGSVLLYLICFTVIIGIWMVFAVYMFRFMNWVVG